MKLGSRGLKWSGEESRCDRLRESDENAASVFRRVDSYECRQSHRRNRGDQSNIREMFSGFAGAVAHHRLGRLRMGALRKAAHHGRGRRFAGHAPSDRSERNSQESYDGEDGVGAAHREKITTARLSTVNRIMEHTSKNSRLTTDGTEMAQSTPRMLETHRAHFQESGGEEYPRRV